MFSVIEAQYNWPVPAGITLDRSSSGFESWIFAQYLNRIELSIEGKRVHTTPGCIIFVSPGTKHSYFCPVDLRHNWMHLNGNVSAILERYHLTPNVIYSPHNPDEISTLFRTLSITYHEQNRFRQEYMRLTAEEIVAKTAMQLEVPQSIREMGNNRIIMLQELRCEMLEHPEKDWNVGKMAARLFLSESFFYTLYKQYYGVSPAHDLQTIRVDLACHMLSDGISVNETSTLCGYNSVYNFIRQFRKITGTTPGAYRRRETQVIAEGTKT